MNRTARAALMAAALASGGTAMPFELTSPAFTNGGEIPPRFTCEGDDVSPALRWRDTPAGTRSLVLIVDDPDAPDPAAPKMTWVHWVLYNLPPGSTGLPEGAGSGEALPEGARSGRNDWKRADYGGPCPPIGRHRYFHKLYALDRELSLAGQPSKQDVEAVMHGHVLATAELIGTYEKRRR
jgi:Raf kinase inhibitor-like YbhB/YbcL family protein